MLQLIKWFFGLFSAYVNPFERKVDKFFRHIKSTDSHFSVRKDLLKLMQENLIVTNIWMEKKFKGYRYLNKRTRRKMYEDVKKIVIKFEEYCAVNKFVESDIRKQLDTRGLEFPNGDKDKVFYLAQIMSFLRPGQYYHYIRTASFGRLLRDPGEAKLEGDCNQVVTLYIYLFSLRFNLDLLSIKLLPQHVCLHFRGIDIEATNGTFQNYKDDNQVLPVTEIISTNLLDLTDFREEIQEISPRQLVKSSQLAYAISSLRSLVAKNLDIAYRNLAIDAMKHKDFDTADFYAAKSSDRTLLQSVQHNAAIYHMDHNSFKKARFYASKINNHDLEKTIRYNEGIFYYKHDNIEEALDIFSSLGDEKMKKACYQKKYNQLFKKVSKVRTYKQAKQYKSSYKEMLGLAQKIGDSRLERSMRDTLEKL